MRSRDYLIAGAILLTCGCNRNESPAVESAALAEAHRDATQEVADARRAESKDMNADAYAVAIAKADGDHKIAIQKCDALDGHGQKVCKDQADADYEAAKADAKAAKVAQQP